MHKSIYKYQLKVTDTQKIELPVGAEILTVQIQNETPCLWALVDPNGIEKETRIIEVFGTGHPISYDMGMSRKYVSSFQLRGSQLVFHVFEYTGYYL